MSLRPSCAIAFLLTLLSFGSLSHAQDTRCTDANLLSGRRPLEGNVVRPEKLTDGRVPVDGSPFDGPESAVLVAARPRITFDLGAVREIRALYLLADNNETYLVSISNDGHAFERAFLAPPSPEPGMRPRIGHDFTWSARYVRVEPEGGDGRYSIAEFSLHCQRPATLPPPLDVVASIADDPLGSTARFVGAWQGSLALVGLAAFALLLPRLRGPKLAKVAVLLAIVGLFGFIRFGTFHGDRLVHPWDAFHYFMGPKYFPELGYSGLYDCLADHERRVGRGAVVDAGRMRDLETNVLHPGSFSTTPAGRCDADFSAARRRAFDADIERFRPLFPAHLPLERMLVDHGYNATPIHNAFLTPFTRFTPATRTSLTALAFLDFFAYIGAIVALYRGFGPKTAALAALFIGTGEPWNYLWTGGSVGRAVWLFLLCAGLALLAKKRFGLGAALITASGLLRLFPLVFVGALGLRVIVRAIRDRRLDAEGKSTLVGIGGTTVVLVLLGGLVSGFDAYPAFVHEMRGHTSLAMANHVGLEVVASYLPGISGDTVTDARLTDPHEVVKTLQRLARHERAPFWILGIVTSLAVLVAHAYRRNTHAWANVLLGACLLFCTIAVANYDCVFLAALAPIAATRPRRALAMLGFTAASQILAQYLAAIELKHALISVGVGALLFTLVVDTFRHGDAGETDEGAIT